MTIAIEDTSERSARCQRKRVVNNWGDDGFVEDLAAGQIRSHVDVGCQDEVLVVIFGAVAKCDQIGGRGDLVWVVRLSGAAAILSLGDSVYVENKKVSATNRRDCLADNVYQIIIEVYRNEHIAAISDFTLKHDFHIGENCADKGIHIKYFVRVQGASEY